MDLMYMSDALSYHSIRTPIYDRYEYKQNNSNNNKGGMGKPIEKDNHSKAKCRICKEKQKKKLSSYIRSKSCNSNMDQNRIVEEEEESYDDNCTGDH